MHMDVGCYVADALDPDERQAFEAHLIDCESCSREVVEFAETSAELSRLVTIGPPPPSLRGSLLAAIREVRPLPPLTDEEATRALSSSKGLSLTKAPVEPSQPTDELTRRRQMGARDGRHSHRQRVLVGLVAAATVLALALGGWITNLYQQRQTQVAQQAAEQRETELLTAPDAQVLTTGEAGARYSFVVSKERNAALFLGTDLADPGAGKELQLWTLQGRQAFPDATFSAASGSQWFTGPVAESTSLAVSVEPVGGSVQPSKILAQVTI